jgi:AcrR family transcriptional regulator
MIKRISKTEDRILDSAYKIFLLFGYHGTTMQQIAIKACVNKSAVHYYFRSKEKLYTKVVKKVLDHILNTRVNNNTNQDGYEKQIWFLITEIYNNKILFERTLKAIYPVDWDEKSKGLMKWLESQISHITMLWDNLTGV